MPIRNKLSILVFSSLLLLSIINNREALFQCQDSGWGGQSYCIRGLSVNVPVHGQCAQSLTQPYVLVVTWTALTGSHLVWYEQVCLNQTITHTTFNHNVNFEVLNYIFAKTFGKVYICGCSQYRSIQSDAVAYFTEELCSDSKLSYLNKNPIQFQMKIIY